MSEWYHNKKTLKMIGNIIIAVIVVFVIVLMFIQPTPSNTILLEQVVRHISTSVSDNKVVIRTTPKVGFFPFLNLSPPFVSSYYGSEMYQKDLTLLKELSILSTGIKILPNDCYRIIKVSTDDMSQDDVQRIGSNLLLKIQPMLLSLCSRQEFSTMSGVLLLFVHMTERIVGVDSSMFIVPTYQNDKLVSVRYGTMIEDGKVTFLPVSYYFDILDVNKIGYMNVQDMNAYLQTIPPTLQDLIAVLIQYVTNPLILQREQVMKQGDIIDIPVDLFSRLFLVLLFTFWTDPSLPYDGTVCS